MESSDALHKDPSYILLRQLESPEFVPSVLLEKSLTEKFCNKMNQCIAKQYSEGSIIILEKYLDCILAVIDKDKKFISYYFGPLQLYFYGQLVSFLEKPEQIRCPTHFRVKVLRLIHQMLIDIPHGKDAFISFNLPRILLNKEVNTEENILLSCEILGQLTDYQECALKDIFVQLINWMQGVTEFFLQSYGDQTTFKSVANELLKMCKTLKKQAWHPHYSGILNDVIGCLYRIFPAELENYPSLMKWEQGDTSSSFNTTTLFNKESSLFGETETSMTSNLQPMLANKRPELSGPCSISISALPKACALGEANKKYSFSKKDHSIRLFQITRDSNMLTNEYRTEKIVRQLSTEKLAELICGMLNSNKGGSIHVGIDEFGRACGTQVGRNERDGFRNGIDNLLQNEILPLIPPYLVSVAFIPIFRNEGCDAIRRVIQIKVPSNMNTVYYLKTRNLCFLRTINGNIALNLQQVRHLTASSTEKKLSFSGQMRRNK